MISLSLLNLLPYINNVNNYVILTLAYVLIKLYLQIVFQYGQKLVENLNVQNGLKPILNLLLQLKLLKKSA